MTTFGDRLRRIAGILGMEGDCFYLMKHSSNGAWFITNGNIISDSPAVVTDVTLPCTRGSRTAFEAMDAAEAWFAPEIDRQ